MTNPRGAARIGRAKLPPRASGCDCPCHKNPAIKHGVACCGASAAPSKLNAELQRTDRADANKALEDELARDLVAFGMPDPERQYKAIPSRDFRWDFAWPDYRLLLEVDGAEWVTGRHNRGVGMAQDSEKQCLAAIHGWFTMRVTGSLVRNSQAVAWVVLYMAGHGLDGPRCPRCHRVTGSNPNATSPADHYYCEECRMTVSEP